MSRVYPTSGQHGWAGVADGCFIKLSAVANQAQGRITGCTVVWWATADFDAPSWSSLLHVQRVMNVGKLPVSMKMDFSKITFVLVGLKKNTHKKTGFVNQSDLHKSTN